MIQEFLVHEALLPVLNIKEELHKTEDNPVEICYHIIDKIIVGVLSGVCQDWDPGTHMHTTLNQTPFLT